MLNLQEIIDKYKSIKYYPGWGGKRYFKINSDIPYNLNSVGQWDYILDDNGMVENYEFLDNVESTCSYFLDEDYTIPVTKKEIKERKLEEYTDYWPYWDDSKRIKTWYDSYLSDFYPHRWYPDREIVAFEIVNTIPGAFPGHIEEVVGNCGKEYMEGWIEITTFGGSVDYCVESCLNYPEWFRPIYLGD